VVVALFDRLVEPRQLRLVLLSERRRKQPPQIARRRPVHAGDLHVAAERERTDPVLDPAARPLHERRPEAEIELAKRHADPARRQEVAGLVDQHDQREPDDRGDQAHATPTSSRACRSASYSSSRSRAGAPSTRPSTSSTSAAMSRKPIRPAVKAATASSFAA